MSRSDIKEQRREQQKAAASESANRAAMNMAQQQASETLMNPRFFEELRDAGIDTEAVDWLEDELGPTFAKGHVAGYRSADYPREKGLLNTNLIERVLAEQSPGRLLKQHPRLHALAQGVKGWRKGEGPGSMEQYRDPVGSREARYLYEAAEVATTYQSLATQGQGLESVTKATAESRVVDNETKDTGITATVGEVFK